MDFEKKITWSMYAFLSVKRSTMLAFLTLLKSLTSGKPGSQVISENTFS